jgi:hypothetical protein
MIVDRRTEKITNEVRGAHQIIKWDSPRLSSPNVFDSFGFDPNIFKTLASKPSVQISLVEATWVSNK